MMRTIWLGLMVTSIAARAAQLPSSVQFLPGPVNGLLISGKVLVYGDARDVSTLYGGAPRKFLEEVAMDVASRLRLEPAVARNLSGYLITAFHHRVRWERLRDRRLSYEGLLPELDWLEMFHGKHRGVGFSFATR